MQTLHFMEKQNEPKIKLSFDGCYNYKKLKEEGLVDTEETKPLPVIIDDDFSYQITGGSAES